MHAICLFAAALLSSSTGEDTPAWGGFRGNNGSGVSSSKALPDALDPEANILWRTEIPAGYSSPIVAGDASTFVGPLPADFIYVRGALGSMGTYAFDTVQPLAGATNLQDTSTPALGEGFFYLVRADLPLASWQTSLGAEPVRDTALP